MRQRGIILVTPIDDPLRQHLRLSRTQTCALLQRQSQQRLRRRIEVDVATCRHHRQLDGNPLERVDLPRHPIRRWRTGTPVQQGHLDGGVAQRGRTRDFSPRLRHPDLGSRGGLHAGHQQRQGRNDP
ncbi:hypothetical protein SDC9_208500 [bioreactor metagenome]|uniref:Uncharacterized protein n=1 Tax=bioreactor metagenome TaxID=1076179 RepID=A0A645JAT5_9ZZZZ